MITKKKCCIAVSFATILFVTLVACNKKVPSPETLDNKALVETGATIGHRVAQYDFVTINNQNILEFESIESYQSIIEDWSEEERQQFANTLINTSSYNSLYNNLNLTEDSVHGGTIDTVYKENFIKAILNNDLIVKIGGYFIKVDEYNQRVLALNDLHVSQFSALMGNSLTNTNILQFSLDDDVLSMLSGDTTNLGKVASCSDSGIGSFGSPVTQVTHTTTGNPTGFRIAGKQDYNRYGIYFAVRYTWEQRDDLSKAKVTIFDVQLRFDNFFLKRKCGAVSGPFTNMNFGGGSTTWQKTQLMYSSGTPLNALCTKFFFIFDTGVNGILKTTPQIITQKNSSC
jgi:hypothetical protein